MTLKLKLQYFGHLVRRVDSLEKTLMLGGIGGRRRRGWQRMRWLDGLTRWTWVWVNSGSWWWTGRLGMLRFMGSQRVGHDWATELNWTELYFYCRSALNAVSQVPSTLSQIPINFPHPSYSFFLLILPQVTHEKQLINIQTVATTRQRQTQQHPPHRTNRKEQGLYTTSCSCSVAKSYPTLHNFMDCSSPSSSVHGNFHTRILEWVAISSTRGPSQSNDRTGISCVSCISSWILYY